MYPDGLSNSESKRATIGLHWRNGRVTPVAPEIYSQKKRQCAYRRLVLRQTNISTLQARTKLVSVDRKPQNHKEIQRGLLVFTAFREQNVPEIAALLLCSLLAEMLLNKKPRILVYTTLFPNSVQPVHGNFVLERLRYLIPFVDMSVVAPIPYFPQLNIHKRWFNLASVPRSERFSDFQVSHPRYVIFPKMGMSTHGISMFAGSLKQVRELLRGAEYDLIDAHYVYPDGMAATMLGKLFNKPVVVSARGSDINLFSEFPTIRPMVRGVLNRAAAVIAVTERLKKRMIDLGCPAEKISVIANGVDSMKFHPEVRSKARQKLCLADNRSILLSVGNLSENKGFHILIETLGRLCTQMPTLMLIIVGDGTYRRRLERQVQELGLQDNVMFTGACRHDELSTWYSAADLCCLASLREGCPNVLLEAMACGCPIVATEVGGIPEIINDSSLGVLVDRTPQAFEVAIKDAFARQWDRAGIIKHARMNSWEKVAARLLNVYSQVLQKVK